MNEKSTRLRKSKTKTMYKFWLDMKFVLRYSHITFHYWYCTVAFWTEKKQLCIKGLAEQNQKIKKRIEWANDCLLNSCFLCRHRIYQKITQHTKICSTYTLSRSFIHSTHQTKPTIQWLYWYTFCSRKRIKCYFIFIHLIFININNLTGFKWYLVSCGPRGQFNNLL